MRNLPPTALSLLRFMRMAYPHACLPVLPVTLGHLVTHWSYDVMLEALGPMHMQLQLLLLFGTLRLLPGPLHESSRRGALSARRAPAVLSVSRPSMHVRRRASAILQ